MGQTRHAKTQSMMAIINMMFFLAINNNVYNLLTITLISNDTIIMIIVYFTYYNNNRLLMLFGNVTNTPVNRGWDGASQGGTGGWKPVPLIPTFSGLYRPELYSLAGLSEMLL